jgi:hypothetical protein
MKARLLTMVHRRDLLRLATAGVAAAAASRVVFEPAAAKPLASSDKRKARYQANSAEVQDFYRVNRYPSR